MRKKHKIYQSPTVRIEPLPKAFVTSVSLSNLQEQKNRFLKHGKTPIFVVQGDTTPVEELAAKSNGKIRFDLLGEAEYILRTVKQNYGVGENYLEHIYGPRIEQEEANEILFDYIKENSLQESLSVYWSNEMPCSARMIWKGYSFKCNKPEARRYSLWLNGTCENPYLRRQGLQCLLDHEIGTHFYRSYNDGFQPWFYDRKKFGLRGVGSFESLCTEEGLAAINTTLRAKEKYLWLSALTYYTACKSTEMTFKQLFDHLGQFLYNPEQRWKHVMRVKRSLIDPNDLGGYGKDQCYFEGAVSILRNIDNINFNLLMSGKICFDEVSRVKRVARLGSVCLPAIMRDMDTYRKQLKKMAVINGLHLSHPMHEPSRAYVQRFKERQDGTRRRRKVRKAKKLKASLSKSSCSTSVDSQTSSSSSKESKESSISSEYPNSLQKSVRSGKNSGAVVKDVGSDDVGSSSASADSYSTPCKKPCSVSACKSPCCNAGDPVIQALVSDTKHNQDQHLAHSSSKGLASQHQLPVGEKKRSDTATAMLPPVYEASSEKLTSDPKDCLSCFQNEDSNSSSPVLFTGLCSTCSDSSSIDQLSLSDEEELESWLTSSYLSPSSLIRPTDVIFPPIGQERPAKSKASDYVDSDMSPGQSPANQPTSSSVVKSPFYQYHALNQGVCRPISEFLVSHERSKKPHLTTPGPAVHAQNK